MWIVSVKDVDIKIATDDDQTQVNAQKFKNSCQLVEKRWWRHSQGQPVGVQQYNNTMQQWLTDAYCLKRRDWWQVNLQAMQSLWVEDGNTTAMASRTNNVDDDIAQWCSKMLAYIITGCVPRLGQCRNVQQSINYHLPNSFSPVIQWLDVKPAICIERSADWWTAFIQLELLSGQQRWVLWQQSSGNDIALATLGEM